jgi:hypothetical protein
MNPFFASSYFNRTWTGAGMTWGFNGNSNLDKKWKTFNRAFHSGAKKIFETNGAALCHELADLSLPKSTNTQLTANNALGKYERDNLALANVAFKTWDSKKDMFWMMSPYVNVKDYIVQKGLFKSAGPVAERLAQTRKYDMLDTYLRGKGYWTAWDVPKPEYVKDSADLGTFVQWKTQWKKGGQRGPYYVRDKASIDKISKEKSLYNYASIVINGWLKAAQGLGNKLPAGVRKVSWNYGKSVGWGFGKISAKKGIVQMTFSNSYYNLNGIFYSAEQQKVWNYRMKNIDAETKVFFQDMTKKWNSIP